MKRLIRDWQKYIFPIFIFVLGLVPIIWFWGKANTLINGVDTNFPLNPFIWFIRRFYAWNNILNAGSDFSSSTAGLFFHFVQVVPYLLGFKLQVVELVSLLFWFLLIVFSSFFLARAILPKRFLPQLLFTLFYSFNIYLFNTWENVKVTNLSLAAGIPLVLGILSLLDKDKITRESGFFLSILAGIVLSGTGINPSYFFSFLLIISIYLLGSFIASPKARIKKLKNFLVVLIAVLLTNFYWILPTLNYVIKVVPTGASIDKLGFTNWVDSLSENTSLFNVLRLQGAWDWYSIDATTGLPLFIPYALNYFNRFPFIVFSLIAPALAIISLIFRKKANNYLYLGFSLMLLTGVFLGAGSHAPTGTAFRFLLNHVPFFSLFRSPWYIFTPLVTLAYAGLIGLLFDFIYEVLETGRQKIGRIFLGLFGAILIAGNLLYCYPLITGKIFRPGRPDGFYVSFPKYVYEAADWLNSTKDGGRIVSYPDDEIENFGWGYRGIESILQLFSKRELIYSSLNETKSPIALLINDFYLKLKRGEIDMAKKIAERLNVSKIFEKNDQLSLSPKLSGILGNGYISKNFGPWNFYDFPGNTLSKKIFSASNLVSVNSLDEIVGVLGVLDNSYQVVYQRDDVVRKIKEKIKFEGQAIFAANIQMQTFQAYGGVGSRLANRYTQRELRVAEFKFEVSENGNYEPILERYGLDDYGISPKDTIFVKVNGKNEVLVPYKFDDSLVYYKGIYLKAGKYSLVFDLKNGDLIAGGDFENSVKYLVRPGYGEGEAYFKVEEEGGNKYLLAENQGKAGPSFELNLTKFDPYSPYYVEVKYKHLLGSDGSVVVEQSNPNTSIKSQEERLSRYPEWAIYSFYFFPVRTDSKMSILVTAPPTPDPLGTKILYDDIKVYKVFTNNLILIKNGKTLLATPQIEYEKVSPVLYKGSVSEAFGQHILVFLENYSPNWKIKILSNTGKQLKIKSDHFSIDYYANGWYLEETPEKYSFQIYYKPQTLYNIGFSVSGLTMLIGLGWLSFKKYRYQLK